MQSPSTEHDVLHAVAPQLYGVHAVVTAAGQLPAPSHVAAAVAIPEAQLADRHDVEDGGYPHALGDDPLHVPPHGATPPPVHAVRLPCGCPLDTVVHVPGVTSHAWHCPAHALLQQYPSTQLPDVHCPLLEHAWPRPKELTQTCGVAAVSQSAPEMQSVSLAHGAVPQTIPLHAYNPQLVMVCAGHEPLEHVDDEYMSCVTSLHDADAQEAVG